MADGVSILFKSGQKHLIPYKTYEYEEDSGIIMRTQLPLILAWASTIHKIQGATLDMADMDLGKSVFEYGQSYVALSRIKSLDGLYLSEFHPHRIKANPLVKAFYDRLMIVDKNILSVENKPIITSVDVEQPSDNIFKEYEYKDPTIKIVKI
jgi:hypothetical protein